MPEDSISGPAKEIQLGNGRQSRRAKTQERLPLQGDSSIDIGKIFKILFKYKYLIGLVVTVSVVLTKLALDQVQPIYEAVATIQIDPERGMSIGDKGYLFEPQFVDPDYLNTQLQLLRSTSLSQQVVRDLELDLQPDFITTGPTSLSDGLFSLVKSRRKQFTAPPKDTKKVVPVVGGAASNPKLDPETAERLLPFATVIQSGLKVTPIPKTRLVQIFFQHHNPGVAQKVVNGIAERYIRNNLDKTIGTARKTSEFLQKRIADLQKEIREGEEDLVKYAKENRVISYEPDKNSFSDRFLDLNKKVLDAEFQRRDLETVRRLAQQDTALEAVTPNEDLGQLQVFQARVRELKQRKAALLLQYKEKHPDVRAVSDSIVQAEEDLKKEREKVLTGIDARLQIASEREKTIRASLETQLESTLKQNETAITYRIRQQEVEIRKELFKVLLGQLKETDISSTMEANNVSITDYSTLPEIPISPRVRPTLTYAFVLSLMAGCGFAFLREYFNTKIKTVEDVDNFVNLPTFGQIPLYRSKRSTGSLQLLSRRGTGKSAEAAALPTGDNIETITLSSAKSSISEAYKQLRTSILLSSSDRRNRVWLITGSQPSEGKTTTSINTAISLTQTGARTVLLDCDLRKPRVHKIFNLDSEIGMSSYLSGQCRFEDLNLEPVIPNLSVIPCGPLPPNPAELLGSQKMRKLLETLAGSFDFVILDGPPVLTFADSVILGSKVDSVLLVVNTDRSRRENVLRSCRMLEEANANLVGIVLNGVNFEEYGYGYGYGYKYGYYNYYYSDDEKPSMTIVQRAAKALRDLQGKGTDREAAPTSAKSDFKVNLTPTKQSPSDPPGGADVIHLSDVSRTNRKEEKDAP